MKNTMNGAVAGSLVLVAALFLAADARPVFAQSPSITVKNEVAKGSRRVEIVINDPTVASETAPAMLPGADLSTPPDGGEIIGTLISGGTAYAVTNTRMLTVGDAVSNYKIVQVTLDHVVISGGARTYELNCSTGRWNASAGGVAE